MERNVREKTTNLVYTTFKTGVSLHIYPNSPESYVKPDRNHWISRKIEVINTDLNCRKCQINDGTLNHVINCGKNTYITVDALDDMENENVINLKLVAKRIYDFIEEVG